MERLTQDSWPLTQLQLVPRPQQRWPPKWLPGGPPGGPQLSWPGLESPFTRTVPRVCWPRGGSLTTGLLTRSAAC